MNIKEVLHKNINQKIKEQPRLPDAKSHEILLYQAYQTRLPAKRQLHDLATLSSWYTTSQGKRGFLYIPLSSVKGYAWNLPFVSGTLCDLHEHNHIELIYIVEGVLKMCIDDKEISFSQGEFVLINSGVTHGEYLYHEACTLICLGIDDSFFDKYSDHQQQDDYTLSLKKLINEKRSNYSYIRFSPIDDSPETITSLTTILQEMCQNLPGRKRLVIGYIERIIDLLTREFHIQVAKHDTADLHHALFQDIQNYIRGHYRTVTVSQIGDVFHYSPDYLNRIFRRQTGLTLSAFIVDIRLTEAMRLLATTGDSINTIAEQAGYHNLGFFYRKFKEKYQILPSMVRKKRPGIYNG